MKRFKPMLAATLDDVNHIRFPVIATPKFDGVRCMMQNHTAVTRTLKTVPNINIRSLMARHLPDGLDGEIVAGSFQDTTSLVMSRDKVGGFTYYVFDIFDEREPYTTRLERLQRILAEVNVCWAVFVTPTRIHDLNELQRYYESVVNQGYEGVCFRTPDSPYKQGRSTMQEQWLVKWKHLEDAEGVVIGFKPLLHNLNEAYVDATGHTRRSRQKSGLYVGSLLGSLVVKFGDINVDISTGFTATQRVQFWQNRQTLIGKTVKFRYCPVGTKTAPRFPTFIGFRDLDYD